MEIEEVEHSAHASSWHLLLSSWNWKVPLSPPHFSLGLLTELVGRRRSAAPSKIVRHKNFAHSQLRGGARITDRMRKWERGTKAEEKCRRKKGWHIELYGATIVIIIIVYRKYFWSCIRTAESCYNPLSFYAPNPTGSSLGAATMTTTWPRDPCPPLPLRNSYLYFLQPFSV